METAGAVVCVGDPGINALATVRSLGRRRIPVHAVTLAGSAEIVSRSRYCTSVTPIGEVRELPLALLRLSETVRAPLVLYIDNDRMLTVLAPHARTLSRRFRIVEPLDRILEFTDKVFQLRKAQEAGIDVPRSWFPESWEALRAIRPDSGGGLIAKPSPARFAPTAPPPFKARVAPDGAGLAAALNGLVRPEDLLVQEFIPGDDSCIYGTLAYRTRDGGRCSVLSVRKHRQTVPGAGIMAVGQVVDVPEVRDMTLRLLESIDYRGVVHTEFKRCPQSGRFYFIEWNNRPGYFHSLGWKAGFDGAWLAYRDHGLSERPNAVLRQDAGHYWINFSGDLMHLSRLPRLALRPSTWAPYFTGPEWAVFDLRDPGPWLRSSKHLGGWLAQRARGGLARVLNLRHLGSVPSKAA